MNWKRSRTGEARKTLEGGGLLPDRALCSLGAGTPQVQLGAGKGEDETRAGLMSTSTSWFIAVLPDLAPLSLRSSWWPNCWQGAAPRHVSRQTATQRYQSKRAGFELARASLTHQLWVVCAPSSSILVCAAVLLMVSNEATKPNPKAGQERTLPAARFSFWPNWRKLGSLKAPNSSSSSHGSS